MNKRLIVALILMVGFLFFCVYTYKLRTRFNVDERDRDIKIYLYENAVLEYALSLYPEESRNQLFFKALVDKYPDFINNKDLCKTLGYEPPNEEKKEEMVNRDTTAVQVMDNIIEIF